MRPVPVDTCFRPVRVPHGDSFIYVPCGRCPACRKSFHSKWRNRIEHSINTSASTLFITLTYSNEHLPLCEINPETNEIVSVTHTRFLRGSSYEYERVDLIDRYLSKDLTFPYIYDDSPIDDIPHFVSSRSGNNLVFDREPRFAVCLRKDVQDFLKRLRVCLSRDPSLVGRDISFTYFICSEYGPKTFRPHYHGLLFFNDSYIASLCHSRYVHESWRKSNLSPDALEKECQYVTVGQGAASYSSKYVTCDDVLPLVLSNKFFKPFHLSSHSVPVGSTCLPFSALFHTVRETDLLCPRTFEDKDTGEFVTVRLPYPSSFWSRYFPKFLFYGNLSNELVSQLYSRIFAIGLYEEVPNLIKEFNALYGIGSVKHTSSRIRRLAIEPGDPQMLLFRIGVRRDFDFYELGYPGSDYCYRVTYSDVLPRLLSDPNFVDYFLFGIPQNRCVVNKIMRIRRMSALSSDNWCRTYQDYLQCFNLFWLKSFSNSISKFYDNFAANVPDSSFSPSVVSEYYPSFYSALPEEITAFNPEVYFKVEDIFHYNFGLSVDSFYDSSGKLIRYDRFNRPDYVYYYHLVSCYFREFSTKRKSYYDKYGSGERINSP